MKRERRKLTRAELRAMGASPGLMAHKVGPDGRARLEQLVGEDAGSREIFTRRFTQRRASPDTTASEGRRGGG